jgi:hypothetical protein
MQQLFSAAERDALTWAILRGDPQASPGDAQAITQWARQVRWQHLVLSAALAGHCGLRHGTEGVDVEGLTAQEILERMEAPTQIGEAEQFRALAPASWRSEWT